MRVAGRRLAVLALVEEQPGLLAQPRVDVVLDRPFANDDPFGHRPVQHFDALLESFEQSDARIVSRQHSRRPGRLDDQRNELGERPIHPLRQRLHDDHVGVAVDDERREQIGFAVHEPKRRGIDGQALAIGDRGIDPPLPERRVDLLVVAGEHAQRDLRLIAESRDQGTAAAARAPRRLRPPRPMHPQCPHDRSRDGPGESWPRRAATQSRWGLQVRCLGARVPRVPEGAGASGCLGASGCQSGAESAARASAPYAPYSTLRTSTLGTLAPGTLAPSDAVYNPPAMHVGLGADHAGFELKDALKRVLDELGVSYDDLGTSSSASVDYPDYAQAVASGVVEGRFDRGILVCGSGIGMSIAANKVHGIRAAVVTEAESARLSRAHNDANVIALGARLTSEADAAEIVRTFLDTEFMGGRHAERRRKDSRPRRATAVGSPRGYCADDGGTRPFIRR